MKKSGYGILALLLAAGSAGLVQAQQEQPSLGELAKQHRGEKKVAKVFTNEDVATSSSATATAQSSSAAAAPALASSSAPAGNQAADKTDKDKKESAGKEAPKTKDSPEVAELKQKLSSYKEEQEGWKKSAKRYQDLLANETSDFRRQMYQDALQGDQHNVQLYQDKIDQAQSDLEKAEKASSQGH
jgi:hypothetical protein